MNRGTIRSSKEYEDKIRLALDAITVDEVLFDYVNNKSGINPAPTYSNRLDAIDEFCKDRMAKYETKMVTMRNAITTATDWKIKLEALTRYRKYEDSDKPETDGDTGEKLVNDAYKSIHAQVDALTTPIDIEVAYQKLISNNPESVVTAPRIPHAGHADYVGKLEKKIN